MKEKATFCYSLTVELIQSQRKPHPTKVIKTTNGEDKDKDSDGNKAPPLFMCYCVRLNSTRRSSVSETLLVQQVKIQTASLSPVATDVKHLCRSSKKAQGDTRISV